MKVILKIDQIRLMAFEILCHLYTISALFFFFFLSVFISLSCVPPMVDVLLLVICDEQYVKQRATLLASGRSRDRHIGREKL